MDEAAQLVLLRELVEIESPTYSAGVRRVADRMAEELEARGAVVSIDSEGHLRADADGRGAPLVVLAHTDTVWDEGTLERMPFRIEGDRVSGPGVYDMKITLVQLLAALDRTAGSRRAVRVLLTADEEVGSRTAHGAIAAAAHGAAAALVLEPPTGDGHLKTARKGLGRFTLSVTGRAAHAGTNPRDGSSAVIELARQVLALHELNDERRGVSVNVGVVAGGTRENVIAAEAYAKIDVRVSARADTGRIVETLSGLQASVPGTSLSLSGGWTRPPLEPSPGSARLFAAAHRYGRELGLQLRESFSGGGSDGNLIGAHGIPVLDGLGVEGAGAHAADEHALRSSLPVRTELLARMLDDPGL